jgi:hypothetical protein
MSNSSINLVRKSIGEARHKLNRPVDGGSHIYGGTMVAELTATGMLVPGSTASSGDCIGVALHEQNNTGSDGDVRCMVESDGIFVFVNGSNTDACSDATPIGTPVYMIDDHTVADNDNSGTLKRAGYFMGMEPDGGVRVLILPGFKAPVAAADVGALTFTAVAGTANTTLQAIPDPTDSPANADALRDDIVANDLPVIRNNFADLANQINAIRTALINAGLMA